MELAPLSVKDFLDDKKLLLTLSVGDEGKMIPNPRVQRPGLALSGYFDHFYPYSIQLFGNTEVAYLKTLSNETVTAIIKKLCTFPISMFAITTSNTLPDSFYKISEEAGIPIVKTPLDTVTFIELVTNFIEDKALPFIHVHGVMMDILSVGVLITGKSGIGKSECALDLVIRGHRLVADDVVYVKRKEYSVLSCQSTTSLQHLMEIRGLGIINIKNLYGVSSIREKKELNMIIELKEWSQDYECDRLGLDDNTKNILDVEIPHLVVPVRPGRNISSIIEVAARNYLLKCMGYNSAHEFNDRLMEQLSAGD